MNAFAPVENWDQIAQNNIFPGESGGDYDAIFGYQNRQPGQFQGVRPSEMTLAQAIEFTNPRGAYGQAVKDQIGYVATPIGAYQVVGTTLREAVNALGLDPNTRFDKATQDLIGQWIYRTQGPGAWEGWRGNTGQPVSFGPQTPAMPQGVMGYGPTASQNAFATQEQERPRLDWQTNYLDPAAFQTQPMQTRNYLAEMLRA